MNGIRTPIGWAITLASCVTVLAAQAPAADDGIERAFEAFWGARSIEEATQASAAVVASGVTVEDAMRRLKAGRTFSSDVPRGLVDEWQPRGSGAEAAAG